MEIRQADPDVKIIAMSGGSRIGNSDYLNFAEKLGATSSIRKPFRNRELLQAVKEALRN